MTTTHHEVVMAVFAEITEKQPALAGRIIAGMDAEDPAVADAWVTRLAKLCKTYVITHDLTLAVR